MEKFSLKVLKVEFKIFEMIKGWTDKRRKVTLQTTILILKWIRGITLNPKFWAPKVPLPGVL